MATIDRPELSNKDDYPVLREFMAQLRRENPFHRYKVHGLGIGRKISGGRPTNRLVLRFYVTSKISPDKLPPEQRIPRQFTFYSQAEGRERQIVTDVIELSPPQLSMPDPEDRLRPVPGGSSISSFNGHNGTLGAWVWDNTDSSIVLLSNRHVLGHHVGSAIIQPAASDGGQYSEDRIGQVKRAAPLSGIDENHEPVPDDCFFVDAAVGATDDSDFFDLTVIDVGPAIYLTAEAAIDMLVEKTGQTTDHTLGIVVDVDYNTIIPFPDEGDVVMCDQIRIEPQDDALLFSSFGDSGSVIFAEPMDDGLKPAVGLLFAGSGHTPPGDWAAAGKIGNVFSILDLGPLCEGGCSAFIDALYADSADLVPPHRFTLRERQQAAQFHSGITRDLQARLLNTMRGRSLITFINRHRAELTTLMVKDGDTRRALAAAFRPLVEGATTTTDVLRHKLSAEELRRIDKLADVLSDKGSGRLKKSLKPMRELLEKAKGKSLDEVFELKPGKKHSKK